MKKQIVFGLPKGSLNDIERGNTCQLLKDAGYDIVGYEPKREQPSKLAVRNDEEIRPVLVRPQSAPKELYDGIIDMAIFGTDWWKEWELAGYGTEKLADLCYGNAKIVLAAAKPLEEIFAQEKIVCYSEYINIAKYLMEKRTKKRPTIEIRGTIIEGDSCAKVCFSDGLTEAYVQKGLADLVVECVQSGKTLNEYGLKEQQLQMYTSAALYINPQLDGWKRVKAESIKDMLTGAVNARSYDLIVFNVRNQKTESVLNYLAEKKLFAEEPTVNLGREWNEITIMVPKKSYPGIAAELRQHGAKSIIRLEPKQIIVNDISNYLLLA